ncbi:hypothetical protein BH11MYX4_BH11MYX4_33610 [soil metagenome]
MQIGRGAEAEIWDDAMFFRRVAYNVLHHGFAGWNQSDGAVFVNTSQLYQTVTVGLLAIAPRHFNVATVVWAAACTCLTFALMPGRSLSERAVTFVGLSAPPVFMAIATGMDTATVLLVVAAFLRVALRRPSPRAPAQPALLAAMSLLVYLARPDALLLAVGVAVGLLSARGDDRARRLATFCVATGAGLALLSLGFRAYYGTALPLATYVKLNPVSIYDAEYIALGLPGKLANLRLVGLLLAALAPFIAMRMDRANVVLATAGLAFIAFHAATTNEIMGYHARFYAPALPLFVCAAARGSVRLTARRRRFGVVTAASSVAMVGYVAYARGSIENATLGSYLDRAPLGFYLVFFLGLPIVALISPFGRAARMRMVGAATVLLIVVASVVTSREPFRVVEDDVIYASSAARDGDLVGIDAIRRCFEEPLKVTHSELGVPGVLFPESKVIDFAGLANPSIVDRSFDFERLCTSERPDFVFRPHRTHRKLNEELSASRCLAETYTLARLPRPSACPLYVRNDHAERFDACMRAAHGR